VEICFQWSPLYYKIWNTKSYTPKKWYELAKDLYELIATDINEASTDILPKIYPKLVVMYEFFRLIREQDFHSKCPPDIGEFQKEIYKMEENLADA